jgi:cytochrome c oxidase subunit I+III
MLVAASLFVSYVFSYLYLWIVSPEVWAPGGSPALPPLTYPLCSAILLACGSALVYWAEKRLPAVGRLPLLVPTLLILAAAFLAGAVGLEVLGHLRTGLDPSANSYSAMVFMGSILTGQAAFATIILCAFACGRLAVKRLDGKRRITFDNAALLYWYTAAQGLCGLVLVHGFPRLIG